MPATFQQLMRRAQQRLGLDDAGMSRVVKVSVPTWQRWVNGTTKPHPLARDGILETLARAAPAVSRPSADASRSPSP